MPIISSRTHGASSYRRDHPPALAGWAFSEGLVSLCFVAELPLKPRRNWMIRATPITRTTAAPARAATRRAAVSGTCPEIEKNSISVDLVFCTKKSTRAMPRTTATIKLTQVQLISVDGTRPGPFPFGDVPAALLTREPYPAKRIANDIRSVRTRRTVWVIRKPREPSDELTYGERPCPILCPPGARQGRR